MDLTAIHPVNFYKNSILQSNDIGNGEIFPILEELKCIHSETGAHIEDTLKDFIINNVSNLSNTFILKILEDNINKDEIAYVVDFWADFNLKEYLSNSLTKQILANYDSNNICNIIQSNIIFVLNQFSQFYVLYKLVYTNEGVELYKFLYKETYGEEPKEQSVQNKYVFCTSIMSNMVEQLYPQIQSVSFALKSVIDNIRMLG